MLVISRNGFRSDVMSNLRLCDVDTGTPAIPAAIDAGGVTHGSRWLSAALRPPGRRAKRHHRNLRAEKTLPSPPPEPHSPLQSPIRGGEGGRRPGEGRIH